MWIWDIQLGNKFNIQSGRLYTLLHDKEVIKIKGQRTTRFFKITNQILSFRN